MCGDSSGAHSRAISFGETAAPHMDRRVVPRLVKEERIERGSRRVCTRMASGYSLSSSCRCQR
jgi:hypothetical protein